MTRDQEWALVAAVYAVTIPAAVLWTWYAPVRVRCAVCLSRIGAGLASYRRDGRPLCPSCDKCREIADQLLGGDPRLRARPRYLPG